MSSPTSALPRTESKLSLHPKAVAAITTKGHFLGLNDAIPDSLDSGDSIRPINPEDPFFMEVVMYSATFVLAYAAHKVLPSKAIGVRHGFCLENSPLACGFYVDALDGSINAEEFSLIANKFKEVLAHDIPITPVEHPEALVLEKLKDQGSHNSYNLLKSKSVRPHYRCYEMDGFITLRRVPLAPSSCVFEFGDKIQLLKEERGIVIRLDSMAPVPRSSSIDEAFTRAVNWGNSTHTGSVGQINEKVLNKPEPFILLEESRFDNEVVACATTALQSRPKLKVVLISGPSASGKTTFAHKLALAFRGMGKNPTVMSTDDYYRDTSEPDYPKQPNGLLDHEVVEALRLDTLKQHFQDLMDGRPIEAPIFDFVHQKPAEHGRVLSLGSDGILIMEGIFTLDPKICEGVDQSGIFTIFISPMPFSFLDEQSFITNSNYRLIRRIARDYLHRGRDASASIKRLTSVNRGEYNAILPHIGNANYFFNSAMAHELPILAVMSVPLLQLVNPCDEVYPHAQQLLEVLQHVSCCSDKYLNNASLLCEFIGASVFEEPPHIITSEKRPVLGETSESEVFGVRIVPNPSGPMTVQDALVRTMPTVDVHSIAGAYLNGEVVPLSQAISVMDESDEMYIRPLLLSDRGAGSILRATCAFIMHVAVRKLWPIRRVVFAHGFGAEGSDISKAYLSRVYEKVEGDERAKSFVQLTEADAEALENEMRRLINSNAPIRVKTVSHATAVSYFKKSGMFYSTSLLESRNVPSVEVVSCEGEMALDMQPLAPHAGLLSSPDSFAIFCHPEGLALSFGVGHGSPCSPSFPERPTLSGAREEILRVADFARHATRIHCVGDMNRAVQERQCGSLADVYHVTDHNRLRELADRVRCDGKVKYIFVAGPSLTGKTTFTSRLLVHLRGAGISTREFGTEHYYKDASTEGFPKKEDGTNDYRDLNALDQDSLKKDLDTLAKGESVKMYGYDIGKGKRDMKKAKTVRGLPPQNGVIVIEGLFALHPYFLADIPREEKLLIVEHPTSILNVDELRFVSHGALRQLRRIARDYLCNRRDARETLSMWDDINASEERNLIPYLDRADVMFNASSPYEIGALRGMLIPLLEGVSPLFPAEYATARQLRRLLDWFHDVPDMRMPHTDSVKSLMYAYNDMPEAVMLCLDTSDHMRNGDYSPSRILSVQGAANLLINSKVSSNPENHVGFLTMGGSSCTMMETLTGDVDRVMGTMTKLPIGGRLHFANALQIATLALSYRVNPRAEKRIIAFVGSPILDDPKVLEKIAKKLRKDDVAVDVIALGCDANEDLLRQFIETVNKQDNSRLLIVSKGSNVEDCVLSSAINLGNEAAEQAAANGGAMAGGMGMGGGFEYGVDPNLDPELAMVLRMSAEEERQRLAALATAANGGAQAAANTGDTANEPGPSASPIHAAPPQAASSTPQAQVGTMPEDRPLTEEEELELAIKMSMEEAERATEAPQQPTAQQAQQPPVVDPDFDAALEDPEFQKRLEEELNDNAKDNKGPK